MKSARASLEGHALGNEFSLNKKYIWDGRGEDDGEESASGVVYECVVHYLCNCIFLADMEKK